MKFTKSLITAAALALLANQASFAESQDNASKAATDAKHVLSYEMVLIRFEKQLEALDKKSKAAEQATTLEDAMAAFADKSSEAYTVLYKPRVAMLDNGIPGVTASQKTDFVNSVKVEHLENGSTQVTNELTPFKTGYSITVFATQPADNATAPAQVDSTIELQFGAKEADAVANVNTNGQKRLAQGQVQALTWTTGQNQYALLAQLSKLSPAKAGN